MRTKLAAIAFGIVTASSAGAFAQNIHVQGPSVGRARLPRVTVTGPQVAPPQPVVVQPGYGYGYGYEYDRPGFARPIGRGPGYYGGGPTWQNVHAFRTMTRNRMNEVTRDVRRAIRRGQIHPGAENRLIGMTANIENTMNRITSDGIVTQQEHRHMQFLLNDLERMNDRLTTGRPGRFGGGPRSWR
jgi:hypothetical protein